MNVEVHHPDVLIGRRGVPSRWRHEGAAMVIGSGDAVRIWPVADWRELVELWSTGLSISGINRVFGARGYTAEDVQKMRALIIGNDHVLPPLDRALFILSGYGRRADRAAGGFTLFGRPARAGEIITAANRILVSLALPQIRYPSAAGCEA